MLAVLRVINAWQTEHLHARMIALHRLHQRRQCCLHRAEHDHRFFDVGVTTMQVRVFRIEQALNHRPRHHREAWYEVHVAHRSPGSCCKGSE